MNTSDEYTQQAQRLLRLLGRKHPRYKDTWALKTRLERNIRDSDIYGDTPQRQSDRAEMLASLNNISLELFDVSLDELTDESKAPDAPRKSEKETPEAKTGAGNATLVFISHSSKDKPFVDRLENDLAKAGLQTWYDKKSIGVSDSIPGAINTGIAACAYFIIVLSPDSVEAPWVLKEIDAAIMINKTIVPVLLQDCQIPILLRALKYADFRTDYTSGLKEMLERLKPESRGENTPALQALFGIIERACRNHELSGEEAQSLKTFLTRIAVKKEKGEKPMSPANPENMGEMLSYSSEILAYQLVSLSEYHISWQNLSLGDHRKDHSIVLLRELQDHVLTSSALVEQTLKDNTEQKTLSDAEKIISAVRSLRITLADIDKYLYSGNIPFEVSDEIERYFDDLFYYLSKYIVRLREFAGQSGYQELIQ